MGYCSNEGFDEASEETAAVAENLDSVTFALQKTQTERGTVLL